MIDKAKIKSYGKSLSTYFGASLVPMVLSLLINPWIAKNMDPDQYAISGYYGSFSSLISPIIGFYLVQFYIKEYFKRSEEERRQLYCMIAKGLIYFSGIMSVFCFGGILVYIKCFSTDFSLPVSPYLALAVFSIPFTGLYTLEMANVRMRREASRYFWIATINSIIGIVLTMVFVVFIKWGAFGKLLAPLMCNIFVFCYFLIGKRKLIFAYTFDSKKFKRVVAFCIPLTLSSALGYFTHGFDRTYLESLGKTDTFGLYVVGTSIGLYLTTFATAIGNTFQPDVFETIAARNWRKLSYVVIAQIALISIVALAFIVLAPFVIDILTAGRYVASTPFAQIISLSTVTSTISFLIGSFCIATGRPRLYLYTTILGSLFIVLTMPIAVRRWEFYGGAWMSVISYAAFACINVLLLTGDWLLKRKRVNT